jgi:hypothetical protein
VLAPAEEKEKVPLYCHLLIVVSLLLRHPICHQSLEMVFQYLVGGVAASLLGFVLLYSFRGKKTTRASMEMTRNGSVKKLENGLCRSGIAGSTDVIIVGAGVAGAALAYSLGKVVLYFLLLFIFIFLET